MALASAQTIRLDWMAKAEGDGEPRDEALMVAIGKGEKDALNTLMTRHMRSIHAFAFGLSRNPDDAEDLTQETFLRCWSKAHTYKPGRVKVSTWLHTLTRNAAIDAFRRRRWILESESAIVEGGLDKLPADSSPEEALEERNRDDILNISLDSLPERQRTALLLCYIRGFSNREAASILGISLDALVSLLARARRALKSNVAALESGGHR